MTCNGMPPSFFPPNFVLQMQTPNEEEEEHHHHHHQHPNPPLFPNNASHQDYHGVAAGATLLGKRSVSFPCLDACGEMNMNMNMGNMMVHGGGEDENEQDFSDDCSGAGGEKKRRLSMEQVRTLEKNFELGNKLEPERKMQLARALGLQPRQVAIWFQNRRARWKTKQLEKDYDSLRKRFEEIKSENEELHAQNKKLLSEMLALKGRETPTSELINLNKDTDQGSCSNRSDNSSDINSPLNSHKNTTNTNANDRPFFQQFLLQNPARTDNILQSPKIENGAQDESFCNMLCGLDDQPGYWTAWSEPQNFH